jgi:hypothetical protein
MLEKAKRKKGGQKGNQNALKHGFYAKVFNEAEKFEFINASDMEGIDEEIALLRLEIKKAISGGDERNLLLLVKASAALEKLVRTHYKIATEHHDGLKEAIGKVVKDFLVPLGIKVGSAVITKEINDT